MKADVRIFLGVALGLGLGLALLLVGSLPATAEGSAHFDLTGDCPGRVGDVDALIKAIEMANGNRAPDTITLAPGCLYTLKAPEVGTGANATGLTPVSTTITINGQGSTIRRGRSTLAAFRIFQVTSSGTLHLKDLTIRDGQAEFGGGIYSQGNLELTRCTVDGNLATTASPATIARGSAEASGAAGA